MIAWILGGIVVLAAAGGGAYYALRPKVTKLKLKWNAHQLICSILAYEWWKLKASEVAAFCELIAVNGWTAAGMELAGELGWWPKDRLKVSDIRKFLFEAVDKAEDFVEETRARNEILKVTFWNSNLDAGGQLKSGDPDAVVEYFVGKHGTKGIMALGCSEDDKDTNPKIREEWNRAVEKYFPKEQTVAYSRTRGDCAFTEHHPSSFKANTPGSGWPNIIVSDNGGTLREANTDGVTGDKPRGNADQLFHGWIDQDHSVDAYFFWRHYKGKEWFIKSVGKRFEAKHGSRRV